MTDVVLPHQMVELVEAWVDDCIDRDQKYENAGLLDEDSVFRLHRLAASIYARAWQDGAMAERERDRAQRRRERAAASREAAP